MQIHAAMEAVKVAKTAGDFEKVLEEKALIAPLKEIFLIVLQRYRMATSHYILVSQH